jgi:hypothetical protein
MSSPLSPSTNPDYKEPILLCKKAGPRAGFRYWRYVFSYSRTYIFRLADISLRMSGHTVTLTSPRCAVRSRYM